MPDSSSIPPATWLSSDQVEVIFTVAKPRLSLGITRRKGHCALKAARHHRFWHYRPVLAKWRVIPNRPPSCGQIAPTPSGRTDHLRLIIRESSPRARLGQLPSSPSSVQSAQVGMLWATAAIFLYVGSASPNVFSRCPTAQPCDAKNDSVKPKDNIPDDRQNKRYNSIVVLYEG